MFFNLAALFAALSVAGTCLAIPTPQGNDTDAVALATREEEKFVFCLDKTRGQEDRERCLGWWDKHLVLMSFNDAKHSWSQGNWDFHNGLAMSTGINDDISHWDIWLDQSGHQWLRQVWFDYEISQRGKLTRTYVIAPTGNRDFCIDVRDGVLNIGSKLQMWWCNLDNPNQVWYRKTIYT